MRAKWIWFVLFLALAVRLPGLWTDFWIDEVWSHNIASQIGSTRDILFSDDARIDNNHPLNTFLIRAIGLNALPWMYRVPSLLAGIGCVLLVARRNGASALLIALSFPFVFYSSEARGYMSAVFFALVAFEALLRNRERFSFASTSAFIVACILGFLSHLTFIHFSIAAMCWSLFWIRRIEPSRAKQLGRWLALHAIPMAFLITLYQVFIKRLTIGGAPPRPTIDVLISTWSMLIGGPEALSLSTRLIACVFAFVAIGALASSVVRDARKRDDRFLFDVLVVFVAPLFLLAYDLVLSARPQPLMVRYFLVSMVFALMAIGRFLSDLSKPRRTVAVAVFIAANAVLLIEFARVGRGGYTRAMDRLAAASGSTRAVVTSDSDFRVGEIIRFYNDRRSSLRQVTYVPGTQEADWFIASSPLTNPDSASYQLDSTYPTTSLSGTVWRLYRRR